jgi:hypothetical protein
MSLPAFAQDEPRVTRFTPQGTAKKVRQARAEFSRPMVAFGDPRAADPFTVESAEPGKGRWVDPRNWVYDFERDVPAGVKSSFRLVPGLKTLAGEPVAGNREFVFDTGGPAISFSVPGEGHRAVNEDQVFILALDAAPDEASVLAHAGFAVGGLKERIGVRILAGEEREALLARQRWLLDQVPDKDRLILLQCRQAFPVKSKLSLVWGRGIKTAAGGIATSRDQVLHFESREPFLAEFGCERENRRAACIPVLPMGLRFNAPLDPAVAGEAVLKGPDGQSWKADLKAEAGTVSFPGPFPENTEFELQIPGGIKDDAGRPLQNAGRFPLKVRTAGLPPLAKFAARFGIVELKDGPALPVTLRNLEPQVKAKRLQVAGADDAPPGGRVTGKLLNISADGGAGLPAWLRKVAAATRETSLLAGVKEARTFALPKPGGGKAFEVVGIPLEKAGLYVVELESLLLGKSLLGAPRPMFVPAAVLVTNLSVHFKQGRESSLVWVTALDSGRPVAEAQVNVRDCEGRLVWEGRTDAQGVARIEAELPAGPALEGCRYESDWTDYPQMGALTGLDSGLFVTARAGEDMSFVHSSWQDGIERWQFNLPTEPAPGAVVAHTVFDRSLLRAGETLSMKHFVRRHTRLGFAHLPAKELPREAVIRHIGSGQSYRLPLEWDAGGVAEGAWSIPPGAKLGSYTVSLAAGEAGPEGGRTDGADASAEEGGETGPDDPRSWTSGRFRVEEFRLPLLKAAIQPPAAPLVNAAAATLDLSVQYLSGGGAAGLPVTVRAQEGPKALPAFEGFEGFVFANGGVREGVTRRGEALDEDATAPGDPGRRGPRPQELVLDSAGTGRAVLAGLAPSDRPRELTAELEFRDPNGETQTASARVPLWPSGVLAGISTEGWALSKDALKLDVAVVDLSGRPVAGAPVLVELFERKLLSHRKRLVGGFYAYDHTEEIRRVKTLCEGRTDSRGRLLCESRSPLSGQLIVAVETRDAAGNRSAASRQVWVAGRDEWWFEPTDHDRMDILPERARYEPGETAVFQVRMPFREATALVCVEREGVLEAWTRPLTGRSPVIEVPVRGNYAPNVYVSVLAVRGRVAEPQPTALVDLGKPAYKFGLAAIRVGWRAHELKVSVKTDRDVYKAREKAEVVLRVTTFDGGAPPPGSEVALSAVDEGLLELMPNRSWEILPAMMGQRPCEVGTATAQMHVVGKRHFGLKALPSGGGGGRQNTRELFDTLLLWKARIPLDDRGEARVAVPLNDAITGFRLTAVASAAEGLFGTGSASIRSTQDLMVFSGLPPLVRAEDRFRAGVTVRNTTQRTMDIEARVRPSGLEPPPPAQNLTLSPGEAREIGWEAAAPAGADELPWEIEVAEAQGPARDRIRFVQKVLPAVPVRVLQATLSRLDPQTALAVEKPPAARAGGGVRVEARPRIASGLGAVADYMRRYPYACFEQKTSAAVALRDKARWERLAAELPAYLDGDGLVKYFPSLSLGDPVLTAYVVAVSHEAGWPLPAEPLARMRAGLKGFVEGALTRYSPLPTADLAVRKLAAIEALSRIGAAEAKMLAAVVVEPELWPTSAVIDWANILLNMENLPQRDERLSAAEQVLRTRLHFAGSVMGFSTEATDRLWWLMVSNDVNAVRLVLTALRIDAWKDDLPRLVRGALARQQRGRWDLTTANAWGTLAMEKFSDRFESETLTGTTRAVLAEASHAFDWAAAPEGGAALLPWPPQKSDLKVSHAGTGKPWVAIQSLAAVPLSQPVSSGYRIARRVTAIARKAEGRWTRGDILRVHLEIEAQADMSWVVVDDPVPAGAAILGTGLGRDSALAVQGQARRGRAWPAYEERSFEAFRAYYAWVPKGVFTVEYTLRLNQNGLLQLPPTRVEALYAPEMHGELPNGAMAVEP